MSSKRKVTFALTIVLGISLVTGGLGMAQNGTTPAQVLSMQKSVEMAMTNNSEIKKAKLQVKSAEIAVEKAEETDSEKEISSGVKGTIEEGRQLKLYPRQAQAAMAKATAGLDYTEKNVTLKVEKAYYDVLLKGKLLDVKKATLKRAQDQLRLAQVNFKAGRFAKIDVTGAESNLAKAQADVLSYDTQYKVAIMSFNKLIGLDVDAVPTLTSKLTYTPLNKVDLEKTIADALKNSVTMVNIREDKAVSDVQFELQKSYYGSGVYSYREQAVSTETVEINSKDAAIDMRIAVKQSYMNLRTAEEQIKVLGKVLEKQREAVRVATLKYKVGLATNADLQDVSLSLDDSEEQYASAVYNYNVAKFQFEKGLF